MPDLGRIDATASDDTELHEGGVAEWDTVGDGIHGRSRRGDDRGVVDRRCHSIAGDVA